MRTGQLATSLALVIGSLGLGTLPAQAEQPLRWTATTGTRSSRGAVSTADQQLYARCGARDLGLVQVARAVVARRVEGEPPPSQPELKELARAAGVAQVWPRAWLVDGVEQEGSVARRMNRWLAKSPAAGVRRCGLARGATADGEPVVAAVTVDAVADLIPLPRQTRAPQWLTIEAVMHQPADAAKVVLLGPKGRPRRALTSLSSGRVRARFNLDQPGRWLIQVMASLDGGPRPVLEAVVFAGARPPAALPTTKDAADMRPTPDRLLAMLNRARAKERLAPLRRDPGLDRVARAHARAMMATDRVAHDAGDGTPAQRVRAARLPALRVGENVASAPTVRRVHQALWNSPSHRANMLDSTFDRVGVALVTDKGDKLWAVQLFAR